MSEGAVGAGDPVGVLVPHERLEHGIGLLGQFPADIARDEVLARPVHPGGVFVEGDQERGVVVGAVVFVEERHPPVSEELLEHHVPHRHAEGRVGAGRDRNPLVGKLGGLRVIGRHDHDLLAAVAGLGHPVSVGRTCQGHVRTPQHQVAGIPPIAGFTHVGLVAVNLRRGGRQVGVPVVEGQHAAADEAVIPGTGCVGDHRHGRDRREAGDPVGTPAFDDVGVGGGHHLDGLVPVRPDETALAAGPFVGARFLLVLNDGGPRQHGVAVLGLGRPVHFQQDAANVGVAHPGRRVGVPRE